MSHKQRLEEIKKATPLPTVLQHLVHDYCTTHILNHSEMTEERRRRKKELVILYLEKCMDAFSNVRNVYVTCEVPLWIKSELCIYLKDLGYTICTCLSCVYVFFDVDNICTHEKMTCPLAKIQGANTTVKFDICE